MKITKKLQIFLLLSIAAALVSSGDRTSSEYREEKSRKMHSGPSHDEESSVLSEPSIRSAAETDKNDIEAVVFPYDSDEESEKAGLDMSESSEHMSDPSDADKTDSPADTQHVSDVTEVDNTPENPSYVGNRISKVFHVPECSSAVKTGSKNKVTFLTSQEALSKGFTPCKICRP